MNINKKVFDYYIKTKQYNELIELYKILKKFKKVLTDTSKYVIM